MPSSRSHKSTVSPGPSISPLRLLAHPIHSFPGQEHVTENSKIPAIMNYDKSEATKAAGAEAESASICSRAKDDSDEGWIKTEL